MLLNDARIYQILFLGLFLILGTGTRDWSLQPIMIVVAIATCLATQWIAITVQNWVSPSSSPPPTSSAPPLKSLLSALITALGLSMLLRVDHASTMILAAVVAILSKFLIQVRGKHLFNPANAGIVAALTLTHDAWVSPGQWGEEGWYALLFLGTGGLVLRRVGRWDTTVAFLGAYAGLEAIRNLWLGWTWDVWMHRLMSGSLLVFALFMITDPRTIPNARIGRLIWAGVLACLTFILRNVFFISTAPFWALFILFPLIILLDGVFPSDRFLWSASPSTPQSDSASLPTLSSPSLTPNA